MSPTSATWTRSASPTSASRSGSRIPGRKMKTNVVAPRIPASASVVRAPNSSAAGPVIAKESGTRPIETNQSKLDTRPSISGGTSVFSSVFHTTMPAVAHPKETNAIAHICHAAPAIANPMSRAVPTPQAHHMNVTWRRGTPKRPSSTAAKIDPRPPAASTVPNVAASPPRSFLMM